MKFSVIGPTHPFRGGISHYTTLLVRQLRIRHDVQFISYSRQYPSWLYPGVTDRDPSTTSVIEERVDHRFDALSLRQWWKVSGRVGLNRPDLVILPWSAVYWSPFYGMFLLGLRRFRNVRALFICHNVLEHEPSLFKSTISRIALSRGDVYLTHSEWDKQNLLSWLGKFRDPQVKACVHPIYPPISVERYKKAAARARLGIQRERVLLFFGFIREYKGLEYLLRSMPLLLKEFPIHLVIAGEVWGDPAPYTELIQKLEISSQVTFLNRYVPNEEVSVLFDAADLVVIPYVSATQSGVVQLSYAFGKPVVVGNVGGLPEAVEDGKTGYLVPPRSPEAIAHAITNFYQGRRESEMVMAIQKMQSRDSWLALTSTIEELATVSK
jgi:glycosyltransferase involved in cell wall biosynthesis